MMKQSHIDITPHWENLYFNITVWDPRHLTHISMDNLDSVTGELTSDSGSLKGTPSNNPTFERGVEGYAMCFNGVDQSVNFGDLRYRCLGNLELCTEGLMIGMWIKTGSKNVTTANYYFSSGGQTSASMGFAFYRTPGGMFNLL